MCSSIACWYVVDGKTGGVIPLLWLFITIQFYFVIRFPRFIIIAILSMVTQVLIIGYELEVHKLGVKVSYDATHASLSILIQLRLQQATDNLHIQYICWRLTDWRALRAVWRSPSSGHSFRIPSRLDHSFEKTLGRPCICSRISTRLYIAPSECGSEGRSVTWTTRTVMEGNWRRLGPRFSRNSLLFLLG